MLLTIEQSEHEELNSICCTKKKVPQSVTTEWHLSPASVQQQELRQLQQQPILNLIKINYRLTINLTIKIQNYSIIAANKSSLLFMQMLGVVCLIIVFGHKRFYLQRKMSLLGRELKQEVKMKEINKIVYQPYKVPNCSTHYLPNQYTCLHKNCAYYTQLFCKECHINHPTININKIATKLALAVREQWARILNDHKQIQQEWKHCLVNINYCLDILNQVKKQVEERSQKYELNVFNQIMNETYSMLKHDSNNVSPEMLVKNFNRLNQKYNLFADQQKISSIEVFEQDRKVKKQQVKQASRKTKEFSESALAFSEELAKIIEEKLKYQKRVSRLRDISNLRLFTLKDLQKQKVDMQEVSELLIQLPKSQSEKEGDDVPLLLQKCHNLKSLRINNKNGRLDKHKWRPITSSFDYLKQLRELVLNIRAVDLKILTELFKQRSKAVRQIESLTLQITDEKVLNVVQVYQFINTMELRNLHLTLARDNLQKQQMLELIKGVRMGTSMTELPMNQIDFNLNKNKVTDGKDIVEVTACFNSKAQKIKTRSIVL